MGECGFIERLRTDKKTANNKFIVVDLNCKIPTYIKFESKKNFKVWNKINFSNNEFLLSNQKIGKVNELKSANNVEIYTRHKQKSDYNRNGK